MSKIQKKLLRALCYIMSIFLAFTVAGGIMLAVSSLTFEEKSFVMKCLEMNSAEGQMQLELDKRFSEIEKKHGIDKGTLKSAYSREFINYCLESSVSSMYRAVPANVGDNMNIRIYCSRQLDDYNASNAERDKLTDKEILTICNEVTDEFNSLFRVENAAEFSRFSAFFNQSIKLSIALGIVSLLLFAVIYFVTGKRHSSFNFIAMALISAGGILISLPSCLILKYHLSDFMLTNITVINSSIETACNIIFAILVAVGIVLIAVSLIIFVSNYKYYLARSIMLDEERRIEQNLM